MNFSTCTITTQYCIQDSSFLTQAGPRWPRMYSRAGHSLMRRLLVWSPDPHAATTNRSWWAGWQLAWQPSVYEYVCECDKCKTFYVVSRLENKCKSVYYPPCCETFTTQHCHLVIFITLLVWSCFTNLLVSDVISSLETEVRRHSTLPVIETDRTMISLVSFVSIHLNNSEL